MYDEIRDAFGQIHATDKMKRSVSEYLSGKEQKTVKSSFRFRPYALASACALLLIVAGVGNWYFWEMPVAYVSVDVNPSVELTLNRRNRVTDAEGLNQDGEAVLEHVQLEGKDYLEAVELLIESDDMQAYLVENEKPTVTVASAKADELLTGLESSIVATHYQGMCRSAEIETVASAHDCGMSLGKYQIYQLLAEYGSGLTTEDCQKIPMCQLQQLLAQYESGREMAVENQELDWLQNGCAHHNGGHHHQGNSHHME